MLFSQQLFFSYCVIVSLMLHGIFFTAVDAYGILKKSISNKNHPVVELISPDAYSNIPEALSQPEKNVDVLASTKKKSKNKKTGQKNENWDEDDWKKALSEELSQFKSETERKIFLTYYEYLSLAIRKQITYPQEAKQKGVTGTVYLVFTLDREGDLIKLVVRGRSGSRMLDRAAVQAVKQAAPFSPLPKGLKRGTVNFYAPIQFKRGK